MQHVRLMRLWSGHGALLLALTAVGVAVAATWTGQALLTSQIFAVLVTEAPLSDPALVPSVLALVAVLLIRPLLVLLRQLLAHHAMTRVKASLRSRALTAFIRRSALDPAAGRTGHDHAAVVDGIENLDAYLSGYIPQMGVTILVVGAVGGTMIAIDPVTGLIAVAVTVLLPGLPRLWDRVLASRGADHWEAYQELHAEFVDSMQGMTTLVAFGADQRREEQLARASQHLLARTLGQLRISLLESGLSGFALSAVPAVVLTTVVVRSRDLSAFEVFVLVLLSVELVRPLRDLAALWHAGYLGTFSGPRVMDLLDADASAAHHPGHETRRASHGPQAQRPSSRRAPDAPGADPLAAPLVRVRGLGARYPRAEAPALVDIDIDLAPGLTAVVGATGSGKSTLAAALVGLLVPESGTIEVDGVACGPDRLLGLVSLVPQDPVLLGTTIEQDIALGLPGDPGDAEARNGAPRPTAPPDTIDAVQLDPHDREVIARAARTAGIGGDDVSLALGSSVGEAGALLSGGQRQRVALARALAQQREILVLDESTSALDPAAETRLVEAVRRDAARTIVAITHRLAVARSAEHVIVLDRGRVVEQGAPDDLLARGGAFEALVSAELNGARALEPHGARTAPQREKEGAHR